MRLQSLFAILRILFLLALVYPIWAVSMVLYWSTQHDYSALITTNASGEFGWDVLFVVFGAFGYVLAWRDLWRRLRRSKR